MRDTHRVEAHISRKGFPDGGWVEAYNILGPKRVGLRNVSITVGQDTANSGNLLDQLKQLQDVVSALQGQFGNLVTRIDALEADLQDSISALNQANANRAKRHGRDDFSEWDDSKRRW